MFYYLILTFDDLNDTKTIQLCLDIFPYHKIKCLNISIIYNPDFSGFIEDKDCDGTFYYKSID